MTVLSCLRIPAYAGFRAARVSAVKNAPRSTVRYMGGEGGKRKMEIKPSRFEWERWKDDLHFYLTLGIVPYLAIVLYSNLRIGPAELAEIPEGYEPRSWEYVRHPIQRFMQRYFYDSYEMSYEKMCNAVYVAEKKRQTTLLLKRVKEMERTHMDYKGWYYMPVATDVHEKQIYKRYQNLSNKGNKDNHESLDEFGFLPDPITNY